MKDAFRKQANYCRELGSPFVERLCLLFAEKLEAEGVVTEKLLNWPMDDPEWLGSTPLRIVGSLHGLVLEERCAALANVFPPRHIDRDDGTIWSAVRQAMLDHADFIMPRLESAPQTNEVRRAAALLPGFLTIASITGLPLTL